MIKQLFTVQIYRNGWEDISFPPMSHDHAVYLFTHYMNTFIDEDYRIFPLN